MTERLEKKEICEPAEGRLANQSFVIAGMCKGF
jgi:hypothetical protein